MKNTVVKYLFILLTISLILVVTISYLLYLKKSAPQARPQSTPPPAAAVPLEAQIGTVMDVSSQADGKIKITVDEKTYLFPADQKVKLYTSDTETITIPMRVYV